MTAEDWFNWFILIAFLTGIVGACAILAWAADWLEQHLPW